MIYTIEKIKELNKDLSVINESDIKNMCKKYRELEKEDPSSEITWRLGGLINKLYHENKWKYSKSLFFNDKFGTIPNCVTIN